MTVNDTNDTNDSFERYQKHVKEHGYDKLKKTIKDQSINDLIAEGNKLLKKDIPKESAKEPTKEIPIVLPKSLDTNTGETSTNPYIKARIQVLKTLKPWRRSEIETMEREKNIDNKFYQEFVDMVITLGDKLST